MGKNWIQFIITIEIQDWNTHPRISSSHPSSNIYKGDNEVTNVQFIRNYFGFPIGFQKQFGNMIFIIHKKNLRKVEPIITPTWMFKTNILSNFSFYWRGPHKADPKKMEETTTQGSYLLIDSSLTCKNNTHLYKKHTTNQYNHPYKKIVTQQKGGVIRFQINNWIKPPRNLIICRRGATTSGNKIIESTSPTAVTNLIITSTGLLIPNRG